MLVSKARFRAPLACMDGLLHTLLRKATRMIISLMKRKPSMKNIIGRLFYAHCNLTNVSGSV